MWVVMAMVMRVVMVVLGRRLVGVIVRMTVCRVMRMVLRLPMNLYYRLNRWMCVLMWMVVRMVVIVIVVMRHSVVMVMPAHAIFDAKLAVFAPITRHQRLRFAAFQIIHALFQQLENLALKTKVGG